MVVLAPDVALTLLVVVVEAPGRGAQFLWGKMPCLSFKMANLSSRYFTSSSTPGGISWSIRMALASSSVSAVLLVGGVLGACGSDPIAMLFALAPG